MPDAGPDRAADAVRAPYRLRSLAPLPGWILAIAVLVFAFLLTLASQAWGRAWGYPGWLQQGLLLALWIGGYLGPGQALYDPCIWVRVTAAGDVRLTRAWPLRLRRDRIPRAAIATVALREARDAGGDPHIRTCLVLATGEEIVVQEGRRRPQQVAVAEALRAAIGLGR
jgi:hypothetical protein